MYTKGFFLENSVGNNALSFNFRENKRLYIPELIEARHLSQIELQDDMEKIAFEDYDFNDKLLPHYGLKNFYHFRVEGKDIYLFDNHNHAFYFWYKARSEGIIGNDVTLIHIDEHADTRDNGNYISREESGDLAKVFHFTNFVVNVGDYIIPAQKEGLIGDIIQIRNTKNLEDYISAIEDEERNEESREMKKNLQKKDKILNLDLDFFEPELDFIDYNLKKKVVLDAFEKAQIVTVCTSPFFINQERAIGVFKELFSDKIL